MTNIVQFLSTISSLSNNDFSNSNISINCQNDLNQWTQDIEDKRLYALQMVDAFGKPDSGLLYGSGLWLGGYDECLDNKEHRLRSSIGII